MSNYNKITALYSRLSVGDEDRDGGESNSIQNQKIFLENYAKGQHLTNIRHYIDDDESGRFFDRSAYSRMIEDVESGKIGVCIMKDLTRWGRDYLQVGNAMEIFRRNNVRFIAVNNGIDSENPDTLEFAPFINIMSEWYAKDISKKVKTGIKTKGMSGKPVATEAPYGYIKAPDNKDFWIIDEEAAEVVRLIFRLFLDGKNRNQIAVYLTQEQIPTPTFYMKDRGRGTCKNKTLNEDNRYKWNKATLTHILTRQEYCGDVVNFKTTKHFRDKRNHYVDRSQWHITENVHEPIIDRIDFENVQRILENAPVKRPNGDGEIHPLSGLLFCKDCGAKMHIRIDYRNGGKRHVAYCSEYHKGKAKNPKCSSPHIMDADLLMQTIAEVLKKIEDYSIINRAEFEALVKKNLAMQQTDQTKKQQKRIPQITTRLEQIDKVLNMPEGLTVHRLIPLFKDWNEVQTRRNEITDGKYLREAVYGLKEPPQEETVEIIRMSEVDTQTVEWLWKPYIPFGKVTIVQGNPGEGKTTFALRLAAACTTGGALPGMKPMQPFQVIYQTAEDGLGDTVKPRLIEAAADLDRVLVIDEAKRELTLSDERIEKAIIQNGARLIILDPIQAYMGDKADMNKANEVRPIFRRLAEVAERTGCAVILIGHLNKAAGGQSAYRGLGSIDFRAAARSVLLIGRVKREPNVRVIIHDKSSLAPEGKPVAFCLDPETGFEWIGEYDITADELLSGAGGNNATKTEQAEKLILELLANGKELASEDIEKAAVDAGISARTVRAAKKNLDGRITSKRIGAAWYHALKK